jgi:hypothetical protein
MDPEATTKKQDETMTPLFARKTALLACAAAALLPAARAEDTTPVVLTFSTVGDSRQDPNTYDQASVGATLNGQDSIWLQNTKAFSRILRTIQAQKSTMLFFNGDMINGYGWASYGYTSNATQSAISGPTAPATTADILGSDLMKHYREYAFWRGLVAPLPETGTYVFPVPGNHETECKACPKNSDGQKVSKVENEQAYAANMGDLILDTARFTSVLGTAPGNANYGPAAGVGPDSLSTDQSKLSYSFDYLGLHFAVINTDPVGQETSAPTAWLAADFAAAQGRGAKRFFVFGHKPAFTYAYVPGESGAGLDATATTTAKRDVFWNLIEQYHATYFSGHEHTYNISQPRGGSYQVIVGSGGSPFDPSAAQAAAGMLAHPATDRDYAWATVKVHSDGGVDILAYGFSSTFGPTQLIGQYFIAP